MEELVGKLLINTFLFELSGSVAFDTIPDIASVSRRRR